MTDYYKHPALGMPDVDIKPITFAYGSERATLIPEPEPEPDVQDLGEKTPGDPPEAVNHPAHYNQGNIEVIDAIEDWGLGFNDGNAVKYIARHQHKGNPIQDLEKARWYLDREITRLKGPLK